MALIPNVRTPYDSKLGLTYIGDQPSLELYRGSSLFSSRPQWLKKIDLFMRKRLWLQVFI
ncbi:hypothetical protein B296_00019061 [Ensete ventricosum]|uniref:Uncharacterized protein n=1 Tax=Ensete ventricosum TaxID=4639 RepID=A0A426XRA1_ENSVE|nr:hypothetical protein B296_00019061 [Ensete ventricosum]